MKKGQLTSNKVVSWIIALFILILIIAFIYTVRNNTFPSVIEKLKDLIWQ